MWRKQYLRLLLTGVVSALAMLGLATANASSANISHSYQATGGIQSGSLVSLDSRRTSYVEPANRDNGPQLLGVAVSDSLIAVDATPGTVQVATSGSALALVSTVNGDIHVGDLIGVSPFNGVGMKALPGSRAIGLAQTAFNAHTAGAKTQEVANKQGKATSVIVGFSRINIAVGTNATGLNEASLNSLQKIAKSLTGRTIPTQRVVISLVITAVAVIALITLVYASIYGSIVSIGRNPLAKYAVFRTLGSVLGLAVLTTLIAGLMIFFLLR